MTQRVGVEAVFDVTQFTKGLNTYVSGLNVAEAATVKFAASAQSAINNMASAINTSISGVNTPLNALARNLQTAATAVRSASNFRVQGGRSNVDQARVLSEVGKEAAELLRRVESAKNLALADIASASSTALKGNLRLDDFRRLRNEVKQTNSDISTDLSQTVNRIRDIGRGSGLTTELNRQIIDLRQNIRDSSRDISRNFQNITERARQSTETLQIFQKKDTAAILGQVGKEAADLVAKVNSSRDKALQQINDAAVRATAKGISPSELRNLRAEIKQTVDGIAKDLALSVSNIRQIGKGAGLTGDINRQVIELRSTVKSAVGDINSSLGQLQSKTVSAGNALPPFFGQFLKKSFYVTALAQAIGLVTSALGGLTNAARDGIETVVFFERLGFALQTNIATELRRASDYTIDMTTALNSAQAPSEALLRMFENMAINSQFTFQQVANLAKQANQFNLTSAQSLRLNQAVLDLSAARGIAPEESARIVRSLGQALTLNKLMATERKELASAGVPILQILEEELGITEEIVQERMNNNEAIAGGIETVNAFITSTEKNFGGAAKRMAFSLGGLLSTLEEIGQIVSREFFGGLLRAFEPMLNAIAEFAATDEFRANLFLFGETISNVVIGAINAFAAALKFLRSIWDLLPPRIQEGIILSQVLRVGLIALVGTVGLVRVALLSVMGPLALLSGAIGAAVAIYVNNFDIFSSVTLRIVEGIGLMFGQLVNVIGQAVGGVINAFNGLVEALGEGAGYIGRGFIGTLSVLSSGVVTFVGFFVGLASQAVDWGYNIVSSLADGMGQALSYVLDILSVIGEAITYLLIPGSPPRLLPDLDKWGTEAAEVYLQGWTEADFSILDKISNEFKSFFSALAQQGKIDEVSIPGMVIGVKEELAQAIAELRQFGEISAETLGNIGQVGGEFGEILTGYVTRYAALALATDAATAAQEKLTAITKQYDEVLKPLQRRLSVIQDQRQTADEAKRERQLQNIIRSSYVSEARRTQAQLELEELRINQKIRGTELEKNAATDAAQAQVDATNEVQKKLEEEFSLFEARVAQQTGINQLLGEQQRLLDQLAQQNLRKAKEEMDKQIKAIQIQRDEMNDLIRIAEIRYRLEHDTLTQAEKQLLNLELQSIELERIKRAKEAGELGVDLGPLQNIPITPEDFLSKSELKDLTDGVGELGGKLLEINDLDLNKRFAEYEAQVQKQREKWEEWGRAIEEVIKKFKRAFGLDTETVNVPVDAAFGNFQTVTLSRQAGLGETLAQAFWDGFEKAFKEKAEEKTKSLSDTVRATQEVLISGTPEARHSAFRRWVDGMFTLFNGPEAKAEYENGLGKPIGQGITTGVENELTETWVDKTLGALLTWFKTLLVIASPSGLFSDEVGGPIGQGIIDGLVGSLNTGLETVKKALTTLKDTVLNFFGFGPEQPTEDNQEQISALAEQKDVSLALLTQLRDGAGILIESLRTTTEATFTQLKDTLTGEGGTVPLMTAAILSAISSLSANLVFQTLLQNTTLVGQYNLLKADLVGDQGTIAIISRTFISLFQKMGDDALLIIQQFIDAFMLLLVGEEGLLGRIQVEFVDEGVLLGENFALGLAQGIMNKVEEVKKAAQAVADAAVDTAGGALETGSPSARAARELGEPFSMGVVQGMLSQMGSLADASSLIIGQLFGFADTVEQRLGLTPAGNSITNSSSRTNVFNLSVATQQSAGGVIQDFGTMRAFAGA